MQSLQDEIETYYDEEIVEVYDELHILLQEFVRLCKESDQLCEHFIYSIQKIPSHITAMSTSMYHLSEQNDVCYTLVYSLRDKNKAFNADFSSYNFTFLYDRLKSQDTHFDIKPLVNESFVDPSVSRQLRKSMEEIYQLYAELKKFATYVPEGLWERIDRDFRMYEPHTVAFETLSDEQVNNYYNFVNACCDALDKFPRLIELAFGGLKLIVDYVFKSSVEDEKDYRDLVPAMNKRFRQAIE